MDTQEPITQEEKQLDTLTEDEVLKLYNEAEEGSEELNQAKEELLKRGYSFEAEDAKEEENSPFALNAAKYQTYLNRYSVAGSLVWELLFTFLAIAAAIYFLVTMEQNGVEISTRIAITTAAAVLVFSSVGVLVGGIRRLANQKNNPVTGTAPVGYFILMGLWMAGFAGAMYYAIKMFSEVVKYSFKYALMSTLLPLVGAFVSIAFVAMFFVLGKEASS